MSGFGADDFKKMLDSSSGAQISASTSTFQPRVDAAKKVSRLRAGHVPKWAAGDTTGTVVAAVSGKNDEKWDVKNEEEIMPIVDFVIDRGDGAGTTSGSAITMDRRSRFADNTSSVNSQPQVDRRLALAQSTFTSTSAPAPAQRRRIHQAQVVVVAKQDSFVNAVTATATLKAAASSALGVRSGECEDEKDENSFTVRRNRAKLIAQQQQQQQQQYHVQETETACRQVPSSSSKSSSSASASASEASSNEYETESGCDEAEEAASESSESEEDSEQGIKPVFVPRAQRLAQQAKDALEEEANQQRERTRKREQQQLSQNLAAECIRRADMKVLDDSEIDSDTGLPDDTDDLDPEGEREAWEMREIERLQEEVVARTVQVIDTIEISRRRGLTDEQVLEERKQAAERAGTDTGTGTGTKVQRRGVFYMDESSVQQGDVRLRDTSGPTVTQATVPKAIRDRR